MQHDTSFFGEKQPHSESTTHFTAVSSMFRHVSQSFSTFGTSFFRNKSSNEQATFVPGAKSAALRIPTPVMGQKSKHAHSEMHAEQSDLQKENKNKNKKKHAEKLFFPMAGWKISHNTLFTEGSSIFRAVRQSDFQIHRFNILEPVFCFFHASRIPTTRGFTEGSSMFRQVSQSHFSSSPLSTFWNELFLGSRPAALRFPTTNSQKSKHARSANNQSTTSKKKKKKNEK